ncbi:heme-dependent oxidative N-demethylase family protein [Actinospongicola halichondriae]|uniref:heme-dependent oxidative N-demethylase family protein n=1 Tax=Actinospongicola halichondriae TaxID=3236844 RepID=UPI003D4E4338
MIAAAHDWFDDLDLDPTSSWRHMGTRSLGSRPWLVVDGRSDHERSLRAHLLAERRSEVFAAPPAEIGDEVCALVATEVEVRRDVDPDSLACAGLAIQEDLCLLRRHDRSWHLDAAMLCFPSRWRLTDKIGRPLVEVHAPTPGYAEHLAPRVDRLLDRLTDRPVVRRNWFVHPDPSLHQPDALVVDPILPTGDVLDGLHIRSERQTLRKLDSGWVLFTIRIQHDPLGIALDRHERWHRFRHYVEHAPDDDLAHRGMAPQQVTEVRRRLAEDGPWSPDTRTPGGSSLRGTADGTALPG